MKKIIIVFVFFMFIHLKITAQVGIGTTNPTEQLEVIGNIKLSGALMPNNNAGIVGKLLTSNGPGNAPTWGSTMLNQGQTTAMGKFFSGFINVAAGYSTLTLVDSNCVISSTCTITWVGGLPAGPDYGDLVTTIEAQNGQWVFHFANYTGFNLLNIQFSYFAFY